MNRTTDHYARVKAFMVLAEQKVRTIPTIPPVDERILRARLILEEALETIDALGLTARMTVTGATVQIGAVLFEANKYPVLTEIVDGCADLSVVTVGTLISCGVQDDDLLRMVDANNLAKFGPGGHRRADGKWVKPPGHKAPDIQGLLDAQGKALEYPAERDAGSDSEFSHEGTEEEEARPQ